MADPSTSPISQPSVMNVDQLSAQPLPRQPQPPYYPTQSQLPVPPTMAEVQPPPPGLSPRPVDFKDIKELLNDRKKLHADLQLYCTDVVLTSARDRILNELDERGKEALKDISPDSEIIKLRFEEAAALHKNFTDAVEELKLKSTGPDEVMQDTPSTEESDANKPSERRGQNRGGYWQSRGAPRHAPYQNQAQGQRRRDWGARDDRDYRERRGDEHYNRDRRDEYPRRDYDRRQDFRGPPTPSPAFNRERPQMDSYDRRPDDSRHPRDHRGPPLPLTIGPPKPSPSIYDAPPMPPMPPNVPNPSIQSPQPGYDYTSYSADQQYSSVYPGYFPQYPQDSSTNGQSYQYSTVSTSAGWDTQTNPMQSVPIQLASFNWNQPGRHTAIPLPTDFMSGPSNAPRLSMPEPHDVLGVIKGVIIRDAQGNIGLSHTITTNYNIGGIWVIFDESFDYKKIIGKEPLQKK
ncbi:663_t:CDS:2 [Racocetra fulgida]|uniref:663_t:CDS:1 n=1 Tax=Racocetra fulgida TaxID=60492 RepID=A0A9N9C1G4_9GLOM|nr:663_t:CDS:2 [Racocetra fulgida]